ncbi:MAG: hypothetical protein WAT81_04520 [Candidatus Moraniibacteriota bacterium]
MTEEYFGRGNPIYYVVKLLKKIGMSQKIYFVIGANGVGKSAVLSQLRSQLSEKLFELHDFDERGVPDNADKVWRMSETDYWVGRGEENKAKGISTVICGFSKPAEIGSRAEIILLDVDNATLEKRLRGRYQTEASLKELNRTTGKTVEKFMMDNIYVSSLLRKACAELGCQIIDTTTLSPEQVADQVVIFIQGDDLSIL